MSTTNHVKASSLALSLAMTLMVNAHAQTAGTATPPDAKPATASSNANVPRADRSFITKAAQGGLAEVQLGQLAAQKATDPQVKQFAQRMVEDHSKANDKLKQVASSKNVTLPGDLPSDAKREEDKLNKLSGAQFDKEYMNHMLSDHKKDVNLFRSESKSAKDPDVKQFASETLPTLEQHLQMAQSIAKSK
jgi:putative membrane protein